VESEFQQGSIETLVFSFSNPVQIMQEAEGRTIQRLIFAGKTTVPVGYAMAIRAAPAWNNNDERLLSLAAENGRIFNIR
jgi:hypothetical protein